MDLRRETSRLRLDILTLQASDALTEADIPHILLKGPSTSLWLYDPPRAYNDVDLLVPLSRASDAAQVLERAGIAHPASGRIGEDAAHSYLLRSSEGFELDLHVSLPTVPPHGDQIWRALEPHIEPLDLGVGVVPALDGAGRCLVIALHALNTARHFPQPARDLELAREAASAEVWMRAGELAAALDITDLFEAGRDFDVGSTEVHAGSARSYLFAVGAPNSAVALERIVETAWRNRPFALLREVFPSRGFMIRAYPDLVDRRLGFGRAYVRRWRLIAVALPESVRIWLGAHRRKSW